MQIEIIILTCEALLVYVLVLGAHSLRRRFGLAHFYALLGGLTAVMSWVTDAGASVRLAGITFMVGSTVFYTSLLLGAFVVYVFDGVRAARVAISTIVGVSVLVPLIAIALHIQMKMAGDSPLGYVPIPSLRINSASVAATLADLIFLAIAWEFLGKPTLKMPFWMRTFLTLLGVMWLDVLLFSTAAFAGTEDYLYIMGGTLISRLLISLFAFPILYAYLIWQRASVGISEAHRPVLSILVEMSEIRGELNIAQLEIERRKAVEREKENLIDTLQRTLAEVKTLRGILPTCSYCKKIRDSKGEWHSIEQYIHDHSEAQMSHGICPVCMQREHADLMDAPEA